MYVYEYRDQDVISLVVRQPHRRKTRNSIFDLIIAFPIQAVTYQVPFELIVRSSNGTENIHCSLESNQFSSIGISNGI